MGQIRTLIETDTVYVGISNGRSSNGRTLVSFTGIGHALNGMDVQAPEFFAAGHGYDDMIFIMDRTRSWGNRIDFASVADAISIYTNGKVVDTLGNSMGGFLAMLVPSIFPVRNALAFVPQFSMKLDLVPWETRWSKYRCAIHDWRVPSLEGSFVETTQYYVVAGDHPNDRRHIALFPDAPNVHKIGIPGFGHAPAKGLKSIGLLGEIVNRCLDGSYSDGWLNEAVVPRIPVQAKPQKTDTPQNSMSAMSKAFGFLSGLRQV